MASTRRRFIQATGAGFAVSALGFPTVTRAQGEPRLGLMTVKTGPLASGGIDMERALVQFLHERNNMLAGRKVELFVGDSGGVPAQARTKLQELVERDHIEVLIGPLAAGEALASDDYIRQQQLPTLSVAAAEDLTQRNPNPWFVRATSTSSQCAQPLADYCYRNAQVPAHGGHRRRYRLRPRDVRRFSAGVRGRGRQDRAEDVPPSHGTGLCDLPRTTQNQY